MTDIVPKRSWGKRGLFFIKDWLSHKGNFLGQFFRDYLLLIVSLNMIMLLFAVLVLGCRGDFWANALAANLLMILIAWILELESWEAGP